MYVNPFVGGVIITLLTEFIILIIYTIYLNNKNKK